MPLFLCTELLTAVYSVGRILYGLKIEVMSVPYPFKKVATAIAFSPYAEANLHESARIAMMLDADLLLIHVGPKTDAKAEKLNLMASQTGIPAERIHIEWRDGEPVESILAACNDHSADLLIAGAMKRENLFKFYTGSVARKLCRKASCSILLLTDRSVVRNAAREIVVSGIANEKTETTVRTANYFGKILGAEHLTILDEIDPKSVTVDEDGTEPDAAAIKRREMKHLEDERIEKLEATLRSEGSLQVNHKCIFGKPGYTIGHFAASNRADLLVMNAPNTEMGLLDRVFTHDLEYVLSDLPCCLMIVRGKTKA